ncbi:MAG TPA: DUF5686 family protein, partial [Sphingobacteriaceae bacterium]
AGSHEIVYSAIGFKQRIEPVEALPSEQVVNITLTQEIFSLKDVVINAGGEDPAYQIIRQAIRARKEHLNEVEAYSAEVYIKGLQRLLEAPKKFLGKDVEKATRSLGLDSNRQGILYLSESQSRLSYLKPDHYREEMISSKVSGSNRAFSFNRATDLRVNFYENYSNWEGLSTRPLVSPIADNALFYYRYLLLGTTVENGQLINKIQVIPRRNNDPVFRGIIYIMEDSWRIHSVDLYLTRDAGINFVNNLRINQSFYQVDANIWMPSSVKMDFLGGLFGFRFGGYYIAVYNNYNLNPDLDRKDFAEVLKISGGVNKKDSLYWKEVRPIPLTNEEAQDYQKKKTIAARRESKTYLDSVDREHNKFKPVSFILGQGYNYRNRFKKENYSFSSLINSVFYNPVEGWGVNYSSTYTKPIDSLANRFLRVTGTMRYGASSKGLHAHIKGTAPVKENTWGFSAGSDVVDYNNLGTISQLGNTINSLIYERNYLKLYEKQFVGASWHRRLIGGFQGRVSLNWSNRKSLPNTTDFKWRDEPDREFTSNQIFYSGQEMPMPKNQALIAGVHLTYDFSNKYVTYPTGKYYMRSKYPTLGLTYTKGINNILGSDADFDLLEVNVSKSEIPMGFYGKTDFYLAAGTFLNNSSLHYPDRRHFAGNQTRAFEPRINGFLLLPYYEYSTHQKFFEGHLEHNFSGFILNKVPLLRKLKLQEIVAYNYLATPRLSGYQEVAFGLEHMFGLKVLYAMSYQGGKQVQTGFKIAYGFGR